MRCVKTNQDYTTNAHSLTENINAGFHFDFDFKLVRNSQYNLLLLIFCCCPPARPYKNRDERTKLNGKILAISIFPPLFLPQSHISVCVLFVLFSALHRIQMNLIKNESKKKQKNDENEKLNAHFFAVHLIAVAFVFILCSIARPMARRAYTHSEESHRCMIAKFVRLLDMDHVETRVEIIMTKI